jgi:predicted nucleic acid-binding protein
MILGDTDFFVDLMRSRRRFHPRALAKASAYDDAGEAVFMAALTRFELFSGSEQFFDPPQERARVQAMLDRHPSLAPSPEAADRAGKFHGTLARRGEGIGAVEALVAATALENDAALLTRNLREFSRVQGLKVEPY